MAALHRLAVATALMLMRLAGGLGARLARPPSPASGRGAQRASGLRSDDLAAAGKKANEGCDFDTRYFEHAGGGAGRLSAGFEFDGPERKGPDSEERSRVKAGEQLIPLPWSSATRERSHHLPSDPKDRSEDVWGQLAKTSLFYIIMLGVWRLRVHPHRSFLRV
ncbi:unnamed protein product [Prorocentrum cordatum]|uniref:Uncharacterized protein n=1 Tax=Prorocentrum cordatum TaxID=2364126 RepID=A0ABN9UQJ4_9DINO|nr:unnamed protein product [Polarella glacialis]